MLLGVEADNPTGATRLYESVGFRKLHTWVQYARDS
jgi:mycothiol synthase